MFMHFNKMKKKNSKLMTHVFFILIPTMHLGFSYIFLKGHKASLESSAENWVNFTLDRNIFKLIQ